VTGHIEPDQRTNTTRAGSTCGCLVPLTMTRAAWRRISASSTAHARALPKTSSTARRRLWRHRGRAQQWGSVSSGCASATPPAGRYRLPRWCRPVTTSRSSAKLVDTVLIAPMAPTIRRFPPNGHRLSLPAGSPRHSRNSCARAGRRNSDAQLKQSTPYFWPRTNNRRRCQATSNDEEVDATIPRNCANAGKAIRMQKNKTYGSHAPLLCTRLSRVGARPPGLESTPQKQRGGPLPGRLLEKS
jgi:hypothetical protein